MIRNLKTPTINNFNGKNLNVALQAMNKEDMLEATNIQILGDGSLRRVPGYTQVVDLKTNSPVLAIYDFQRAVDKKQFIFAQSGGNLYAFNFDGTSLQIPISFGISTSVKAAFVKNAFIAYVSDGTNSWRIVDEGGILTAFKWGMTPPATAPAITVTGSANFSLKSGRQYCYCKVSEYTDSLGIVRTSVSAPSPISAFSGPVTNQQVNVSSIEGDADPQCNKLWVFATFDAAQNTQSTFYFAAEIGNPGAGNATTFTDTLTDDQLDDTRQAPFNINTPPPASDILNQFQNRIWAATPSFIQYSAFEEALLGIPEECWPAQNFIPVPSGSKVPTAMITHNSGSSMLAGSIESWMNIQGFDSKSISSQDRVLSPGPAGKKLVVQAPTHIFWVGVDKRLWAWNGIASVTADIPAEAIDFGYNIGLSQPGTTSLNELTNAQLANGELKYFSYEEQHYIALFANTDGTTNLNWMALWEIVMVDGRIKAVFQTDKFPLDPITCTANVFAGSTPYLYLGTANGKIMRWPDGFQDAGKNITSSASTAWLGGGDVKSQFMWADLLVDDPGSFIQKAQVYGVALDAPDMNVKPSLLQIRPYPVVGAGGQKVVRVNLRSKFTAQGKYIRLRVVMPSDALNHQVSGITLAHRPLFENTQ